MKLRSSQFRWYRSKSGNIPCQNRQTFLHWFLGPSDDRSLLLSEWRGYRSTGRHHSKYSKRLLWTVDQWKKHNAPATPPATQRGRSFTRDFGEMKYFSDE